MLTFPKGQAYPQAASGTHAWDERSEGRNGIRQSLALASMTTEDLLAALMDTPLPSDAPRNVTTFNRVDAQMSQAQILYSGDLEPAYGYRDTSSKPIPVLGLLGDVQDGSSEIAGGLIGLPGSITHVDPRGTWANPLFHHHNTDVPWEWTNRSDGPARNVMDIDFSSLRLRGVRLPPQPYEENPLILYHRLISEGADSRVAVILRDVIFAAGVTVEALMAPIQTRKMSLAYGGAKRMWQLLLETKMVIPGKKKHFCLLCPVGGRPGYQHARDAVRHFNREHFGFSFPCESW